MTYEKQEQSIRIHKPKRRSQLYSLFTLPWCCIVPVLVSWLSAGSAFLATLLRPLMLPLLTASILLLSYSHYTVWVKGHRSHPQIFWLSLSTSLSIGLWIWSIFIMRTLF